MNPELGIDIETFSSNDIKCGMHKYAEAVDFAILLFSYSFNDGPVEVIDIALGETIPDQVLAWLIDPNVTKTAHNAPFEILCISTFLKIELDPMQWSCTMAWAAQAGLPLSLDNIAKVLKTVAQKDAAGKRLIKFFTMPVKPLKKYGNRTRHLPGVATLAEFELLFKPETAKKAYIDYCELVNSEWVDFRSYVKDDVRTEQGVRKEIAWFKIPAFEKKLWVIDQKINNLGIMVDMELVNNAVRIDLLNADELVDDIRGISTVDNPRSAQQVMAYLNEKTNLNITSLNKSTLPLLKQQFESLKSEWHDNTDLENAEDVLYLREQASRTSIKKYLKMQLSVCANGRIKGLLQIYGANRTRRWAGRNIQPHNLKKSALPLDGVKTPHDVLVEADKHADLKELTVARNLVKAGNLTILKLCYADVGLVLSYLMRPAFIPAPGKKFYISDLAAIEARIAAWLAGEQWRLELFKNKGADIYLESVSRMLNIPLETLTKKSPERQTGKVSELSLGYQGGPAAIMRMEESTGVPLNKRIPVELLPGIVKAWRKANPKIVQAWYDLQNTAIKCIRDGFAVYKFNICFRMQNRNMIITLPSDGELVYINTRYTGDKIIYEGLNQTTKQWQTLDTYGGKLFENIVQAIARDVLAISIVEIDERGYPIPLHVHDEVVVEHDEHDDICEELTEILSTPVSWAPGLPLSAETFSSYFYKK